MTRLGSFAPNKGADGRRSVKMNARNRGCGIGTDLALVLRMTRAFITLLLLSCTACSSNSSKTGGPSNACVGAKCDTWSTGDGGTAEARCGCQTSSLCQEVAADTSACVALQSTCGTLHGTNVNACATENVTATCEGTLSGQGRVYYYNATDLASVESNCTSLGGTLTTTTPEVPTTGRVCSCQRNAAVCVEGHETVCDHLACATGLQTTECSDTGRLTGKCIYEGGLAEIVFYTPATEADARANCTSTSGFSWIP